MASLSPPFILCPLSERKDLLGMSEDRLENKIIITIGKNIAIRYHVLEQKQETSWTSARHWLTSRVVYCSDFQKYGAVIDNNVVALWDENDSSLNQMKKYKFTEPIFELKPTVSFGSLVVFANGMVVPLSKAAEDRKVDQGRQIVDPNSEIILNVEIDEKSGHVFVVKGSRDSTMKGNRCWVEKRKYLKIVSTGLTSFTKKDQTSQKTDSDEVVCTEIIREQDEIIGHCIVPAENNSFLLYLCSDGYLYKKSLLSKCDGERKSDQNQAKGSKCAFLAKYVSQTNAVVMRILDDCSSIIIYGCDPSEEGAVVFIYDITYDLLLSKQSLKLYGTPPIMEKIGRTIFVPLGLHILVLSFRVTKSLLSSVVGQHQMRLEEEIFVDKNPWIVKAWDTEKEIDAEPKELSKTKKQKLEQEKRKQLKHLQETYPTFWKVVQLIKSLEEDGQPESMPNPI